MDYWTKSSRLGLLAMILLLSTDRVLKPIPGSAATPGCVTYREGDLIDEIGSIVAQMPGPGSDGMLVPTTMQMQAWEALLDAVAQEDLAAACDVITANSFPYTIVYYTDAGYHGAEYLILEENMPVSVGWGTYVLADEAESDLVIEVPHPGCEWQTEKEGAALFRQTRASALLLAGTHRCANTSYSPCSGTTSFCGVEEPHRTSDVAHATQTIFFASHRALVRPGTDAVAVQLHGCTDPGCPDLFISNATCQPGDLAYDFYAAAVAACAPFAIDIADCHPSECSLVGTTNVQGRYSNGIATGGGFDACVQDAPGPSDPEQFLHLEQSRALRDDFGCLAAALSHTFMDLYESYLPVISDRRVLESMDTRPWNTIQKR